MSSTLSLAFLVVLLAGCEMSNERYVALLTRADSAMTAHQDRLERDFHMGTWPQYDSTTYTFMLLRNVRWAPPGRRVETYLISPHARS